MIYGKMIFHLKNGSINAQRFKDIMQKRLYSFKESSIQIIIIQFKVLMGSSLGERV